MGSARVLARAGRLVLCAGLTGAIATGAALAAAPSARIVLLSAGDRASIVVEFDDEVPRATAIEAPDSQSFDVEIGPVRSQVANQLLQAARQSPLVTEVRVRSVPQGPEGTLMILHVTARTPVSGLVRRAQRRVYIDLEPLSIASASKQAQPVAARPEVAPASAAARAPGRSNNSPELTAASAAARGLAPRGAGNGAASPLSSAPPPTAVAPATPSPSPPIDEIQRRADRMAGQLDVKSLEKLKADWIARRASQAPESAASPDAPDPIVEKIDQYLDEARKKRLLADARLFNDSKPSAAPAAPAPAAPLPGISPEEAFQRAIDPLIPELEKMNAMLSQWQPGFVPAASLPQSLEALTIRLRAVRPPGPLSASHERLCAALGALAKSWVPGPDGISLIPVGNDARLITTTKGALYDFLQLLAIERSTGPGRSAPPLP